MGYLLNALRNLCDIYPVSYIIMISCAIACLVPSILLLVAVLRSSIHTNCRMLMSMWIVTQLLVYGTVCWLSVDLIVTNERYFKQTFTDGNEIYILSWYLPIWLMTTCFELGISLERGFSIRRPSKYHSRPASYSIIFAYFIFSVLFSFKVSAWILSGAETIEATLGTIFSNLMDVGAFAINYIVLVFARRKNKVEHKQLNERYQIREAYLIAQTMMPVYCLSTALKMVIIAANWMYVMNIAPLTVSQTLYLSLSEISCGLTSLMFILHHVRLRSKLDRILGRSNRVISIIEDHQEAGTTANHFQMLTYTWNHNWNGPVKHYPSMPFLAHLQSIFDSYPIAYLIMISCGMICVVPSILLLIAVLRSSIHSNCRILMCLWIAAQLLVYATVGWISVSSMIFEERYYKQSFDPNGPDAYILTWYIPIWITTTCFELGITLERGLSMRKPSKYHSSSAALPLIFLYFIFTIVFSFQVGAWILSGAETTEAALGTIFSNLMDIGAFSTNVIVLLFARKKNKREHNQLNERYQIREGYLIARAMMPVYCMSTALKVVIICINWMYVTNILPHTVTEVMYMSLSEISCGLTSSMFLLHHVRLRSKLDCILGRSNKVCLVIDNHEDDTPENHFKMLSDSWNR